jgi:hypothetical protein
MHIVRVYFLRDVALIINITLFRANFEDYTYMCQFKFRSIQVKGEANASFHIATGLETTPIHSNDSTSCFSSNAPQFVSRSYAPQSPQSLKSANLHTTYRYCS